MAGRRSGPGPVIQETALSSTQEAANAPTFTAHNIRLDDGSVTRPEQQDLTAENGWCLSARRALSVLFPDGGAGHSIVDLGCLEGGFTVEFARMGFDSLGLEVRESNLEACRYVQERLSLPNLRFVRDDAWNLPRHGVFDVVYCCGLLYHIESPVAFVKMLARQARKAVILNTHFATSEPSETYALSEMTESEGVPGRWFAEYDAETVRTDADREPLRWASWSNDRSFWIKREHIFGVLYNAGFDLVWEQMDWMGGDVANAMERGYYRTHHRGIFVGVRTGL